MRDSRTLFLFFLNKHSQAENYLPGNTMGVFLCWLVKECCFFSNLQLTGRVNLPGPVAQGLKSSGAPRGHSLDLLLSPLREANDGNVGLLSIFKSLKHLWQSQVLILSQEEPPSSQQTWCHPAHRASVCVCVCQRSLCGEPLFTANTDAHIFTQQNNNSDKKVSSSVRNRFYLYSSPCFLSAVVSIHCLCVCLQC